MFIQLNQATVETSGKEDLVINNQGINGSKKLFFKALDSKERDEWFNSLVLEKSKAPKVTEVPKLKKKNRDKLTKTSFKEDIFDSL